MQAEEVNAAIRNRVESLNKKGIDYREEAEKFLNLERWIGDDPILLITDAASTTTGISYKNAKKHIKNFDAKINSSDLSFADLASMSMDDEKLRDVFSAERKRRVLIETANVLKQDEKEDLESLQEWAEEADPYKYEINPIGRINGVGLRTFQYLRMISGVDTIKPDRQVKRFLSDISNECRSLDLAYNESNGIPNMEALRVSEKIANETRYSLIELDQIAWWTYSEGE